MKQELASAEPNEGQLWWKTSLTDWFSKIREREEQIFLGLTLVIGVLTGFSVIGFILLTEHLGM